MPSISTITLETAKQIEKFYDNGGVVLALNTIPFKSIRGNNMFLNLSIGLGISIFLAAFIAEYFDSSLGMGYGTTLTPVLLFMGYTPMQIVPAVCSFLPMN